ncbi:MAG: hypothetical protein HY916_07300 [Desulfovibrio sp.]|jgi:Skp family chaperone for outer membrane proteins|nr:hypothetical protein [Desulfovibrio sp.]
MAPTSSSPNDAFDLDGLDMKDAKPMGAKASAAESDFEKELEALFAEELASSDETPASAPPVGGPDLEPEPAPAPDTLSGSAPADEDILLLDDLVADAPDASIPGEEEDILDLSAFAAGGEMDLTPPADEPGGKDGVIDLSGLDEIITGLGDKKPAAPAEEAMLEPEPLEPAPLDSTDMADLLETLDVPKAAAKPAAPAPAEAPEDDLLELSLGDLVEEAPDAAAIAASIAEDALNEAALMPSSAPEELQAADESALDLTLPDLSDPEPGRDLIAEQEQADLGGDLNLSLPDMTDLPNLEDTPSAGLDQVLEDGDLDMSGLMEGIEPSAGEEQPELPLNPDDLLAQIPESGAEPASEPGPEPGPEAVAMPVAETIEEPALPLADAALGAVAAGAAVAGVAAAGVAVAEPAPAPVSGDIAARLAELATQVMGNSVAVVRLEGQLAERDKALAEVQERLQNAQAEAQALRDELSALRGELEGSLGARLDEVRQAALDAADKAGALGIRVDGAEKAATGAAERLALLEDRQTQLDREIFSEISRAVPREAARVIREEIAHLAASMRDE